MIKFYMSATQTLQIARKDDKFFQLNWTQVIWIFSVELFLHINVWELSINQNLVIALVENQSLKEIESECSSSVIAMPLI